jgi:4-amino-4-deoxy-L-arabinose transferase-like glycosyltransferase
LASVPCLAWMMTRRDSAEMRIVALWTIVTLAEVAAPGLFWPHYYMLPLPGLALCVGTCLAVALKSKRPLGLIAAGLLGIAVFGTLVIQVRDYLLVPPEQLTIRYKGGRQWVALRDTGRDLKTRARIWKDPHLYLWGWQSPLFIYGDFDSITPHFFGDPLLKAHANDQHPLIVPRLQRIMHDVQTKHPELIFCGDPPFPALRAYLVAHYYREDSAFMPPTGEGLWIRQEDFTRFEEQSRARSRRKQTSE